MSAEENKAIVRRFYNARLNEKRLDRLDELVAQDYIDHSALPGQAPGLEGAKERWAVWMAAIPDLRSTLDDMLGEGDRFGARWTREGTHQGSLLCIPPSGRRIRFGGMSIFRVAEGKVAEQWEEFDKLILMQQFGAPRMSNVTLNRRFGHYLAKHLQRHS